MAWMIIKSAGDEHSFIATHVDGPIGHTHQFAENMARNVTAKMLAAQERDAAVARAEVAEAESERLRAALDIIASEGCDRFESTRCIDAISNRERWCRPCMAHVALVGNADSDLPSLATTLAARNQALEAENEELHRELGDCFQLVPTE